jgi:hypothetical protein
LFARGLVKTTPHPRRRSAYAPKSECASGEA